MWTALVSGFVGMVGTAIGILLGHKLGERSQHKHWVADHRRGEFRKLLTILHESLMTMMTDDRLRKKFDAETRMTRIIADRIFIARDIKELGIMERWLQAARRFEKDRDGVAFNKAVEGLSEDLQNAALATIREQDD